MSEINEKNALITDRKNACIKTKKQKNKCRCNNPYFPKERLSPSVVSTLKQMFLKSEIVSKKKCKEVYSVMISVNDIYILRKKLGQRSPHPD